MVAGPTILGADANTLEVDALDFDRTRTHWHTGQRRLKGLRGDDALWGPCKVHGLRDALRAWLDVHPERLRKSVGRGPTGPSRDIPPDGYPRRQPRDTETLRLDLGQ